MKWIIAGLLTLIMLASLNINALAQEKVWEKKFGGSGFDTARDIIETSDGGFIFVGTTKSYGNGGSDIYLVKTDSEGIQDWRKAYGGSADDAGYSIQPTKDNGFIVAGSTTSFGAGGLDAWILKLDAAGTVQWDRPFGGTADDEAFSVKQTKDGGYIIAGYTKSFGNGGKDLWVFKLNPEGDEKWFRYFGTTSDDEGKDAIELRDNGYIVTGYTTRPGSGKDLWILELDNNGKKIGEKIVGSKDTKAGMPAQDIGYSIKDMLNGSYVVAGTTESSASKADFWLIKAQSGNIAWDKKFGGPEPDESYSVDLTPDDGFILAGRTKTHQSKTYDIWLVRTDSGGNELWNATFGGSDNESAFAVRTTSDSRYILAGQAGSNLGDDALLVMVKDVIEPVLSLNNSTGKPFFL
ncbi:MAG: hypothetical protein LUQ22_03965 [Methanotrichaceae archaeon]|nr:hypothetical protein [Methanotrichaceae archaeon]